MAPILSISRRTRRTPFTDKNTSQGVSGYTVYNHMLLPTVFESLEADYHHLKKHVQVWDVSCQRQIEVSGPDAAELIQMLIMKIGGGFQLQTQTSCSGSKALQPAKK